MTRQAIVTGAFSNIGSAVAAELLRRGWRVGTLTNRRRPPGAEGIRAAPLLFSAGHLARELAGADLLVSTYWIRLPHAGQSFDTAVTNLRTLYEAAARAGVGRVVQVSVSNAALDSGLGYYQGKARADLALAQSGLSHAIVRPTLVVGPRDVLTSNIAWFLRRFPLFPLPAGGAYRLQPVTLADTARLIADAGAATQDLDLDAAGPEVFTFREYVECVARACGVRRLLIGAPAGLALAAIRLVERFLHDIVLTREELAGLRQELLLSRSPARGTESVANWLSANGGALGRRYVNDLDRHFGEGAGEPIARS